MHLISFFPPCSQSSNSTGLFQKTKLQKTVHSPIWVHCKYLPFQNSFEVQKHVFSFPFSASTQLLPSAGLSPACSLHPLHTCLFRACAVCPPSAAQAREASSCPPLSHLFKAMVTGTKQRHRYHLSWFPAQGRHKLMGSDNLPHTSSQNASFTQMHNMLSSQRTRRQEAQCKTAPVQISAWATQQKWGSCNSRQVKSTSRLTVWDSPKITKKFKPSYFDNTEPSPTRSFE